MDANRVVLKPGLKFSAQGIVDQDTLVFKDLGRQISWKTVFHIEYAGPIIMHALCYYLGALFYGQNVAHSYTQTVAFWCVVGSVQAHNKHTAVPRTTLAVRSMGTRCKRIFSVASGRK